MLSLSVIVLPDENSPSILNIWISAYQTTRKQYLKISFCVCRICRTGFKIQLKQIILKEVYPNYEFVVVVVVEYVVNGSIFNNYFFEIKCRLEQFS